MSCRQAFRPIATFTGGTSMRLKRPMGYDADEVRRCPPLRGPGSRKVLTFAIHPTHLSSAEYTAFMRESPISFAQSEPKLTLFLSSCVRRVPLLVFQTSTTCAVGA